MPQNFARNRSQPKSYGSDSGGMVSENGPCIGEIMNNVDPTRSGRVQVYIENLGGLDKDDPSSWRTVSYLSPFFGETQHSGTTEGVGTYPGNVNTYGMWFTPPDIGVRVLCFFVNGDPNHGYYVGCVPSHGMNAMVPAVGGTTEINNKSKEHFDDVEFYNAEKPVHTVVEAVLHQQGLTDDDIRGKISTSSQRESPSNAYGVSTPGRPVYAGGFADEEYRDTVKSGDIPPEDVKVIARRGGHSFIMDDGDLDGKTQMVRIRTSKGHQITLSDDGDCLYIAHANGQSWVEMGKKGAIDVYSSNSVNIHSEGSINMHANDDINLHAKRNINIKSDKKTSVETGKNMDFKSKAEIGMEADVDASIYAHGNLTMTATRIDLNGPQAREVEEIVVNELKNVEYTDKWGEASEPIKTITTRVPTHEPYHDHSGGVETTISIPRTAIDGKVAEIINDDKIQKPKY